MKRTMIQLILIGLIALTLSVTVSNLLNYSTTANSEGTNKDNATTLNSVYLVPNNAVFTNNIYFSQDKIAEYKIQIIEGDGNIAAYTSQPHPINILYVHPQVISEIDSEWLVQQYKSGTAIVAIDTPISALADTLGVATPFADLDMRYARGRHFIAYALSYPNPHGGQHENFYADFQEDINHALIIASHTTTEAMNTATK